MEPRLQADPGAKGPRGAANGYLGMRFLRDRASPCWCSGTSTEWPTPMAMPTASSTSATGVQRRHRRVMRRERKAGGQLFVDFHGVTVPVYDPMTGELATKAERFVASLGACGYLYAETLLSQQPANRG